MNVVYSFFVVKNVFLIEIKKGMDFLIKKEMEILGVIFIKCLNMKIIVS